MIRVGCIQLSSGDRVSANLARAEHWLAHAAALGVRIAVLPENFAHCAAGDRGAMRLAKPLSASYLVRWLKASSRRYGLAIVACGMPLAGRNKPRNACIVVDQGRFRAAYAKMHLFEIRLGGGRIREADAMEPGRRPVIVRVAGLRIGLAICYDLRFPELFCAYLGCDLIALGAAFTVPTGRAHWEVLLRARAIENQCYLAAAAQWGTHPGGRKSWGHSMIVDPWGRVLARLEAGEGLIVADLSKTRLQAVRRRLPALSHRRAQGRAPWAANDRGF